VVRHPGAAAVIPFLTDDEVLLVRQYRHPIRSDLWEIPAGKLDPGEDALTCARRELQEETGYVAEDWTCLGSFYTTPGFSNERITLYLASGLRLVSNPDDCEIAEHRVFALAEIERMIDSSEISDAKTILAISWHLARVRGPG